MSRHMYVNLPVSDLSASTAFFKNLGFDFKTELSDESTSCMVIGSDTLVMLLAEERFAAFTPKAVCDAARFSEVLLTLRFDSREEVEEMVRKAVAGGGTLYSEPDDHELMYGHGFQDLDGHIWELVFLDPSVVSG